MSHNFSEQFRVYYEDTDAGGIVYHANYLRFWERARTDFLRSLGVTQAKLAAEEKVIFVVRRSEIDYIAPARLDDLIDVTAAIESVSNTSLVMHQEIRVDGRLLAQLKTVIVCVSTENFKPKKLPEHIKNLFSQSN